MLDLRWVVANLDEAKRRLATRSADAAAALAPIEQLASERKALIQATETRRAEQKKASEQMRTLRGEDRIRFRGPDGPWRLKYLEIANLHGSTRGFINAMPDFLETPKVMNGASDLMVTAFGDRGRHARTTIGVAVLPLDAAVEVEGMFEVS